MSATLRTALDPATLLDALLRTPSPTGAVAAAAAQLVDVTVEAGFASHIDVAGNVVMRWGAGEADGGVLLLGHLDTVPGDIPVRAADGRIHGRGTVDAKGPLAAAIAAVTKLPRTGCLPVTVIAAGDEEGLSLGAAHLRDTVAPPRHLVILEPSGWDAVTTAYRGCVRLTATVERPSAHHAGLEPGAADLLVRGLALLQARHQADAHHRELAERAVDRVQVRVNRLTTSDTTAWERAAAGVEIRVPAGITATSVIADAVACLEGAHVEVLSASEPVRVSRANPTARALVRAIGAAGGRPRYTTKTGTSDLNVVWPAWRCDAAVYGPGDSALDHTAHESIDVAELRRGAAILHAALLAMV